MTTRPEVLQPLDPRLFADPVPEAAGQAVALAASHCSRCDRYEFPRRGRCPLCGDTMVDGRLTERGTLTGFTAVLHQAPQSLLEAPYVVGVAAFPEGLSVLGVISGAGIDEVAVGDSVAVVSVPVGEKLGFAFSLVPE